MKTKGLALIMLVVLAMSATAQESEKRFGFELNGGPSFPTNKFVDGLKVGFGFEGTFHYRFMSHVGVYAGWGANWLSTETSLSNDNLDYEETGYVFGLSFNHPIGVTKLAYYLRAGALYNHIEIENNDGEIISDSGHGIGYQLAGGIDINLGRNWSLTPGLKFNTLSRDNEIEGVSKHINYQYISARIGIVKKF
jgi:opacity protein-like surface antigen